MNIKIYPDDIVKLCLWDNYVYYIIGTEKEAEKILKENKEIDLQERDALIIGLLKVIKTDNLIHKFNNYVIEFLTNKSIKDKETLLIRKRAFDIAIDRFSDKFPSYWECDLLWINSIKELNQYLEFLKKEIEKLEVYKIVDKNITYEFYNTNNIKKLLKFNY